MADGEEATRDGRGVMVIVHWLADDGLWLLAIWFTAIVAAHTGREKGREEVRREMRRD